MKKTPKPSPIFDYLHRGFVVACLGVTAYGLVFGGYRFYNYWTVIRPARLAEKQKLLQEDPEELRS